MRGSRPARRGSLTVSRRPQLPRALERSIERTLEFGGAMTILRPRTFEEYIPRELASISGFPIIARWIFVFDVLTLSHLGSLLKCATEGVMHWCISFMSMTAPTLYYIDPKGVP